MLRCPYFFKNPLWIVLITASFALSSCASFFESVSAMTGQPGRSTPTTTTIPPTNVPVERPDAVRAAILTEAEKYIDVPYQSPSRAPTNFDCSAFVSYIYKRSAGLDLPASSSAYARVGREISFQDAQPGDLLVFTSSPGGSNINHVAILYKKSASGELRGSYLIHAVSIPTQSATIKGNPNTTGVKITEMGKRGDGNWRNEYFLSRIYTMRNVLK